ncbi:T9SS type A sorting domain-containing protein [Hymenobacter taeanensis]|uniref:T9SS type A sorting domain-containing protein n=1 Tax=Hymenobacter taeanensis TaxID=2735321 RepID=A0A6M6BMP2_9BACT|nr:MULTISPECIES: T9SS type A sorting domain-containing protein [Hymenobacter]QJX49084.1 T9SS type A sorting domain-containing protein [Hymenobacter taeanensis]UOQ81395.1 T9SS type A sorting domain-containing protein [Hymenobacter sp. 5414T-23]
MPFASIAQNTYLWQGTSTSWNDPLNWSPARLIPATTDVLIFDGAVTPSTTVALDYSTTQTVGQVRFSNAIKATLTTNSARELLINGNPNAVGLTTEAGTTLAIVGTQASGSGDLIIRLAANVPARLAGRLELKGSATANSAHQLLSTTVGAIEFLSGSYVQPGTRFTGFLFGSATANKNSVIFRNGSTYEQATGSTPFGSVTTYQVTNFEPNSYFLYTATGNTVGLSGRTYGKLEINTNRTLTISTYSTNPSIIQSDLIITAGVVTINTSNVELRGNLLINGGSLVFNQDANNNALALTLNGTAAQRIGGTAAGSLTLPSNTTLALNNAAGLTLERPVVANGPVTLSQGLLSTSSTNRLTLGPVASISGSASSFVQGPLVRQSSTTGALFFPIGKGTIYRPLTLNVTTAPAGTTAYIAEQQEGRPSDQNMLDDLRRVSSIRYYSLTSSPAPAAGTFAGNIALSFGSDDRVADPNMASFVIARSTGAGWNNLGHLTNSTSALTSNSLNSLGDFALGSTEPNQNPLPVSLTSFSGSHQPNGVVLRWATASEKQNAYFEVERQVAGQPFRALGQVAGKGSSTTPAEYSYSDNAPVPGVVYYRLRQVDANGTATYSSVAAVLVPEQPLQISLYPNPAIRQLNLTGSANDAQYRVLNEQGTVLLIGWVAAGQSINVESLRPGLYRLEIVAGRRRTVRAFVRSRE